MATKGGHIDLLPPPPYPATGSATGLTAQLTLRLTGYLFLGPQMDTC